MAKNFPKLVKNTTYRYSANPKQDKCKEKSSLQQRSKIGENQKINNRSLKHGGGMYCM